MMTGSVVINKLLWKLTALINYLQCSSIIYSYLFKSLNTLAQLDHDSDDCSRIVFNSNKYTKSLMLYIHYSPLSASNVLQRIRDLTYISFLRSSRFVIAVRCGGTRIVFGGQKCLCSLYKESKHSKYYCMCPSK